MLSDIQIQIENVLKENNGEFVGYITDDFSQNKFIFIFREILDNEDQVAHDYAAICNKKNLT